MQGHAVDILPLLSQTGLLLPEIPGLLSGLSGLRVTQRKQHLEFPRAELAVRSSDILSIKQGEKAYILYNWKEGKNQHMAIKESYRNIHIQLQEKLYAQN